MPAAPIDSSLAFSPPARPHAPAAEPVVVALTEELSLLEALAGAIGDSAGFTAAPTMERFADLLIVSGADLALIDCSLLDTAPGAFFSRVHQQFPKLTLLAIGDGTHQQQLAPQLGDGTILRFAHRPLSAQRLKLFLETARRHNEGHQALAGIAAGLDTISTRYEPPRKARASFRPWWFILALGLLLAGALAYWWPSAPASDSATPSEPGATTNAREALPSGDAAAAPLPSVPDAGEPAADPEVQHWVELANERMQEGALIAPANDNAQSYINAASARAPQNAAVRTAAMELGARLISATRSALAAGDLSSAERWLAAARDYGVGASTLTKLEGELAQARVSASARSNASSAPAPGAPGAAPAAGGTP